jgi:hypothetical protein
VRGKISLFLGPPHPVSPAAKPFTSDERPSRGRGDRGGVAEFVFPSSSVFITPPWPSPPQWRCFLRAEVHRGGEGREGYTAVRDRSPIGHVNRTRQRPQQPGIAALFLLSPSLKPGHPFDVPLGERIKVRGKISLFLGPPSPWPSPPQRSRLLRTSAHRGGEGTATALQSLSFRVHPFSSRHRGPHPRSGAASCGRKSIARARGEKATRRSEIAVRSGM